MKKKLILCILVLILCFTLGGSLFADPPFCDPCIVYGSVCLQDRDVSCPPTNFHREGTRYRKRYCWTPAEGFYWDYDSCSPQDFGPECGEC